MLRFFTTLADRYYPFRWRFMAATIGAFALGFGLMFVHIRVVTIIVSAALGPSIGIPWGLLCMCVWFNSIHGNLRHGWLLRYAPGFLRTIIQWYAAVFLVIWLCSCTVVWPIFVILYGGK
jgi:hypothetical protein